MSRRIGASLTAMLAVVCSAAPAPALAQAPAFEKGDRVCFFGDSIFHGGKVHSDLLLFYATRFPEAPMQFHNAGIAGDMTKEATRRVSWDVQPFAPSVTVMMFGMNDVGRWLFGDAKASAAVLQQRQRMMDAHIQNQARLIDDLKKMGSRIILCTPTPYDQTTQRTGGGANAKGVDDALAAVAENVRRVAREGHYGLVDFHQTMDQVLHEQQAKDPAFTMMDGERVHPNDAGHMLMTYIVLKAQGVSPTVSQVVLDAAAGKASAADNCTVTNLQKRDGGLAFTCLARSLPYPLAEKEKAVLAWVPFMQDLNQETLKVEHLAAGDYQLLIDSQSVGTWSSADLAAGINLAGNEKTPQYKQAVAAMEFNEKRRNREVGTLRIFAALEHDVLRPKGIDTNDMAAVRSAMDKAIEEEGRAKSWRFSYFTNLSKVYYAEKPHQQQTQNQLSDMSEQVFKMAQPKPHQYEIRPAAAPATR